jgi:hypothetical protein
VGLLPYGRAPGPNRRPFPPPPAHPPSPNQMLELVRADAEQLLGAVAPTSAAADAIGGRVSRLDAVQGRVRDALGLVDLILDRTSCVSGVQAAMAGGDFEAAAGFIATFLDLERRLAGAAGALSDDTGQVEEQRQLLLGAKGQLEAVIAARLDDAVAARDHAAVMRFVKLHKPLGIPQARRGVWGDAGPQTGRHWARGGADARPVAGPRMRS